jgi:hypothetical protein
MPGKCNAILREALYECDQKGATAASVKARIEGLQEGTQGFRGAGPGPIGIRGELKNFANPAEAMGSTGLLGAQGAGAPSGAD